MDGAISSGEHDFRRRPKFHNCKAVPTHSRSTNTCLARLNVERIGEIPRLELGIENNPKINFTILPRDFAYCGGLGADILFQLALLRCCIVGVRNALRIGVTPRATEVLRR